LIKLIKKINKEIIHSKIDTLIMTFILARLTHLKIYLDTCSNPSPKEYLLSQINGNSLAMNEVYQKVSNYVKDCSFNCIEGITTKIFEFFKIKNIDIRFSLDEANATAQFLDGT
jgi:hypothetical protein